MNNLSEWEERYTAATQVAKVAECNKDKVAHERPQLADENGCLADIGYSYGCEGLRINVRKGLTQAQAIKVAHWILDVLKEESDP